MEWAFTGPYLLAQRLGVKKLSVRELAEHDLDDLIRIFTGPPALHRFPKAMAERTQALARTLVERFNGDPASVWKGAADGTDLVKRIGMLPGFGKQKAQIFGALLAKRFGVQPDGWQAATGAFGEDGVYRSVADITDDASLAKVREYKKEMKAAAKKDA